MDSYASSPEYHFQYPQPSRATPAYDVPDDMLIPASFEYPSAPAYSHPSMNFGRPQITGGALELHAPIPLTGQNPPLLDASSLRSLGALEAYQTKDFSISMSFHEQQGHDAVPVADPALCEHAAGVPTNQGYCGSSNPLQATFPTPSELLAELAAKGIPMASDDLGSDARSESASKARRRAMSKRVGFIPTDPDTISSHEKKRHYLESLEQYILYLHEQFALIHREHPPLERVVNYKGLSSRSIRTVLVHMENTTRDLNIRTLAEEERFVSLRDEVLRRERDIQ